MKSKYTVEEWQKIIAEYKSTHAVTKITKKYGISKSTLYEWCTKLIYKDRKYSKTNYSNTDIYLLERKIQVLEKENNIFRDCGYYISSASEIGRISSSNSLSSAEFSISILFRSSLLASSFSN